MDYNIIRERLTLLREIVVISPEIFDALDELERLATIGRYTEMAFEEIMPDFTIGLDTESRNFTTVDELIAWGESQEGEDV